MLEGLQSNNSPLGILDQQQELFSLVLVLALISLGVFLVLLVFCSEESDDTESCKVDHRKEGHTDNNSRSLHSKREKQADVKACGGNYIVDSDLKSNMKGFKIEQSVCGREQYCKNEEQSAS